MIITNESKPICLSISVQKESDGSYIIGSKEANLYITCSEATANIAKKLNGKTTINQIALELGKSDQETILTAALLIKTGIALEKLPQKTRFSPLKIRKAGSFAKKLFGPIALLFYLLNFMYIIFTGLSKPFFLSGLTGFFWSSIQSFNIATFFIFSIISLFIHESGHILAGKAFNTDSKVGFSTRLHFFVVETRFPNIYSLPLHKRIIIYMAGIFFDITSISLVIFAETLFKFGYPYSLIAEQFILVVVLGILWEFMFFMKTDLYYVITDIFKVFHLQTRAKLLLTNVLTFNKPWLGEENISTKRKRIVIIYAMFFLVGTFVTIVRYFIYAVPIYLKLLLNLGRIINLAYLSKNYVLLVDSAVSFVLMSAHLSVLVIYIMFRRNGTKKKYGN